MALPDLLDGKLRLPLIGAPMFIVSQPDLVIEQCRAGIVGAFPALNARPPELLEEWLQRIERELGEAAEAGDRAAPFAVNQIVHPSNTRLLEDMEVCVRHRVPIVITSVGAPGKVVEAVHSYGGLVFHDVINMRHARKAIEQGVDGIIAVCAGAGGHGGLLSPFALVKEIRKEFDGVVILSGVLSNGSDILAAQAIGADLAYFGTRFIATDEAVASAEYKQMLVDSSAADIVYSDLFTGIKGNYLRASIENAGLDPDKLPPRQDESGVVDSLNKHDAKAWRDIWGAGQGVGSVDDILPVRDLVQRLEHEYRQAKERLL